METKKSISTRLMHVLRKFNRMHLNSDDRIGGQCRKKGLKHSEIYTLFALRGIQEKRNIKGIMVTELSKALYVSPPTISQIMRVLSREGYITREHSDTDRRSVLLSVSPKGHELCRELHDRQLEKCIKLTEYLGMEDTEKLAGLLDKALGFISGKHCNCKREEKTE